MASWLLSTPITYEKPLSLLNLSWVTKPSEQPISKAIKFSFWLIRFKARFKPFKSVSSLSLLCFLNLSNSSYSTGQYEDFFSNTFNLLILNPLFVW